MHNELLTGRQTENRQLAATSPTHPVVARKPTARSPRHANVPIQRSNAGSVASTYRRVRQRPVRTLFLVLLAAYVALTAAVVFGSPLDAIDRAVALSDFAHRYPDAARWLLRYCLLYTSDAADD